MPHNSAIKTDQYLRTWDETRTQENILEIIATEIAALNQLSGLIAGQSTEIMKVCDCIRRKCHEGSLGRLVITGIGKAGKIGEKLAATFASTGTPSFFLHPAEARHGDLGMVGPNDVVLALSNSGSSEEVLYMLPSIHHIGATIIAMVGQTDTPIGKHADMVLTFGRVTEACHLGLAPSASTTTMLAFGDALALTIQKQRRFTPAKYARYHPGGALGRKLMTCAEVMRTGERIPSVTANVPILDCLKIITRLRAGLVILVDADDKALGVFTDGDMRRLLTTRHDSNIFLKEPINQHIHRRFVSIHGTELVEVALRLCSEKRINELPVIDEHKKLIGLIDLQDLADRGF